MWCASGFSPGTIVIMDARSASAMRPCYIYLRAVGRKVLWSSVCVCLSVCLSVRTVFAARYLKNRFMDHHQIWWVGAGGEPLEQVQFWC